MKLIELHILQSFPVSCLNRDDVGSPKSAIFGGVSRARVSSQCLKRAIRLSFNESCLGNQFSTQRTRLAHEQLTEALKNEIDPALANKIALDLLSTFVHKKGASGAKTDKYGRVHMPALIWFSPAELKSIQKAILKNKQQFTDLAALAVNSKNDKKKESELEKQQKVLMKEVSKGVSEAGISDAPDIAMFGRMIANDASLNIEGAAMFSHALSTHQTSNDIDFYTAVDDIKAQSKLEESSDDDEDDGAAMMGTLEFNAAVYYRYIAINIDLLKAHLDKLNRDERKDIVGEFVRNSLIAIPGARKNSMNAFVRPTEVLARISHRYLVDGF